MSDTGKRPLAKDAATGKLGFGGLTAVVFGMMVGAGIYNIPQNMAVGAGLGAVLISWGITAVGMIFLVATFKILADRCRGLTAGIYQYAQHGFGDYTGFNMAWGYWLCTSFANVAYAVMLCDSLGAFFPSMLNNGTSLIIFGSVFIWIMFFLVSNGVKTVKVLNNVLSVLKVGVIAAIIILLAINIKLGMLTSDFWAFDTGLGGLGSQIKSTMLVTLWCFIGIEGAVMLASHAKREKDVGKAGVTGFLIAWVLYVLVSIMSYGVMTRQGLSTLDNPSVAYVLKDVCGDVAYYFVIVSVIISILGGWVAWTLVCAVVPYEAASVGIFPKAFLRKNRHDMPALGLLVSSLVMQTFLLVVVEAENVYMTALSITGMMILPCYLFSGLYLVKGTYSRSLLGLRGDEKIGRYRAIGIGCVIFCLWMLYSGGLDLLLFTSIFYLAGLGFYIKARRETELQPVFTGKGKWILIFLIICSIASIAILWLRLH